MPPLGLLTLASSSTWFSGVPATQPVQTLRSVSSKRFDRATRAGKGRSKDPRVRSCGRFSSTIVRLTSRGFGDIGPVKKKGVAISYSSLRLPAAQSWAK